MFQFSIILSDDSTQRKEFIPKSPKSRKIPGIDGWRTSSARRAKALFTASKLLQAGQEPCAQVYIDKRLGHGRPRVDGGSLTMLPSMRLLNLCTYLAVALCRARNLVEIRTIRGAEPAPLGS